MKVKKTLIALTLIAVVISLVGCQKPCASSKVVKSELKYPLGSRRLQTVHLTKMAPGQVILNEPFNYKLRVENLTNMQLVNVKVSDTRPRHMKINSSDPVMTEDEDKMIWDIGTLGPKECRIITLNAVATEMSTIDTCANVTFDIPTCAKIEIVNSRLKLTKHVPAESLKCNRIPISYVVTNEGTATACDIMIEDTLPNGMVTSDGGNRLLFTIESLEPGECQEFKAVVDATKSGQYASSAIATARQGGKATSNLPETMVTEPILSISETCPASQYIGRSLTYEIMVSNTGNGAANDTMVTATIPEHTTFKSSSAGGVCKATAPSCVTWNIGTLKPDSSKVLTMKLMLDEPGTLETTATARAFCAEEVSDTCKTVLEGIPGILLEVIDISDPIEVGGTETYIITVTNQGSALDTNIQISAFLEDNMQYISATGPTEAMVDGDKITFSALDQLAPKESASWRVNVKAVSEGDVRFKATMNSDELGRSVIETEATRFYK